MYYAWFHNYHMGEDDKWVIISPAEFDLLQPYESELRRGNGIKNISLEELIFETIMGRDDADLRPSEIERITENTIIEIALC